MSNNRIDYFDIAKGIGILCIIAGHMGLTTIDHIVFTFHVPLFFLISGYFISLKDTFNEYAIKRTKNLIIPYIFTSICLILAEILRDLIYSTPDKILSDIKITFIEAIYGSGTNINHTLFGINQIGAIWFLLALLWALLIVKLLINKKYGVIFIVLIAIMSYISSKYIWLPLDIQSGGTASVFVYIGAYIKKKKIKIDKINYPLFIIGLVILALEVHFEIYVSIVCNYYKYTIVSVIGALFISYSILCISKVLEKNEIIKKFLCFLGCNSIIILCIHLIELNNAPWGILYNIMTDINIHTGLQYLIVYILKLIFILICTMIILRNKTLKKIFSK